MSQQAQPIGSSVIFSKEVSAAWPALRRDGRGMCTWLGSPARAASSISSEAIVQGNAVIVELTSSPESEHVGAVSYSRNYSADRRV